MTATGYLQPNRIHVGDVRDFASQLAPASVQAMITSPPYWGLRSYPVPPSVWGGEAGCTHEWGDEQRSSWANGLPGPGPNVGKNGASRRRARKSGQWCCACGAWLGQLGGEPTVEDYVEHLVGIFRLLWPALKDDGTLWLNLGDTYAFRSGRTGARRSSDGAVRRGVPPEMRGTERPKAYGAIKHKDLCLVPWRAAMALQADGWYLRSAIIWEKPNALPESVRDRPSNSYEPVFLLAKRPRYHYDREALSEPVTGTTHSRGKGTTPKGRRADRNNARGNDSWQSSRTALVSRRNARTVWRINTERYPGEHDSTFPSELARRCVVAGARRGDLVCDPFAGTGTVAAVARAQGREWIGCDLDPRAPAWTDERLGRVQLRLEEAAD